MVRRVRFADEIALHQIETGKKANKRDWLTKSLKINSKLQTSDTHPFKSVKNPLMILELMIRSIAVNLALVGAYTLYLYMVGIGAGVVLVGMMFTQFYHIGLLFYRWQCWIAKRW